MAAQLTGVQLDKESVEYYEMKNYTNENYYYRSSERNLVQEVNDLYAVKKLKALQRHGIDLKQIPSN